VTEAATVGRDQKGNIVEAGKDAGIGALGGAAVGALIGGLVGAGGGTLYGVWDNKKRHDENFRASHSSCIKAKGYSA
jgi:hypothetical protein